VQLWLQLWLQLQQPVWAPLMMKLPLTLLASTHVLALVVLMVAGLLLRSQQPSAPTTAQL
jgi:hypothetical protein